VPQIAEKAKQQQGEQQVVFDLGQARLQQAAAGDFRARQAMESFQTRNGDPPYDDVLVQQAFHDCAKEFRRAALLLKVSRGRSQTQPSRGNSLTYACWLVYYIIL